MNRRTFLRLAAGAATLPAVSRIAWAQGYPTRPVHIVVGVAAGGGNDIVARLVAQSLSERLGQQFLVESRPGGNGTVAREAVAHARDGHTLLLASSTDAIRASLPDKFNVAFGRDVVPVAGIARVPYVMLVNRSFPSKNLPEFIAHAKANPGKINMGSSGAGGVNHVVGELFKTMADVNLVHVPYRGGAPALTDLIGGQIQVLWASLSVASAYIHAGTLRALAVTTAARLEALPDVPATGEFVPGYEATPWLGIGAPKSTPAEVISKLNNEVNAALGDSKLKSKLAELGDTPFSLSVAEFDIFISGEVEKWGRVVRTAKINLE
jgi:tripartite-type tricarboxylate transporter receptor subunit TctC